MAANEQLKKLTGDEVRDTVERLKGIEQKAAAVLNEISDERANFNRRVRDEIDRRKKAFAADTERAIAELHAQSRKEIETKTAEIERECEEKINGIKQNFAAHKDEWRKSIFDKVLL